MHTTIREQRYHLRFAMSFTTTGLRSSGDEYKGVYTGGLLHCGSQIVVV